MGPIDIRRLGINPLPAMSHLASAAPKMKKMRDKIKWDKLPGIPFGLDIERYFNLKWSQRWMRNHWQISLGMSAAYCIILFVGTRMMRKREKFDLHIPLGFWSLGLSIFSLFGSIRIVPELVDKLLRDGWTSSICDADFKRDPRVSFWLFLFVLSKAPELVDTMFIMLRKQKLIFLHWFHHIVTLTYAFYVWSEENALFRWFASMNLVIHTLMYGYYAIRAFRLFKVPFWFNQMLTSCQILQMIVGMWMNVQARIMIANGQKCNVTSDATTWGIVVYSAFFILFCNFFIHTYVIGGSPSPSTEIKTQKQE